MAFHLVVARYTEPVAWTAQHRGIWNVHIVEKFKHCPNEGREASSYFWWIIQNYETFKPEDKIAFVQGNPFDHCPQFDTYLRCGVVFGPTLFCDRDGWPTHSGLRESIETGFGIFNLLMVNELLFVAGAQFVVRGKDLLKFPLETYQEAYDWTLADPNAAWAMERLWLEVFQP